MLAGVVLHATLSLLPGFDAFGFPIPDRTSSLALAVVYYVIHMFRMTTFFVVAGFFGHVLQRRVCEPDRQRLTFAVVEHLYFGHIRTPSLIASVGYAVTRKPPSADRFATAHVQRLVPSAL